MSFQTERRPASPRRLTVAGLLILLWASADSGAIDGIALDIGALRAQHWQIEGVQMALTGISEHRQQLTLTIKKLALPKPFDDVQLADIRCTAFSWDNDQIVCARGKASIVSKRWRSPQADFTFRLGAHAGAVKITGLRLFGGTIDAELSEQAMRWQVKLNAQQLDSALLQKQFAVNVAAITGGTVKFELAASGEHSAIDAVDLTAGVDRLTLQTADGSAATEALSATAHLHADHRNGLWQWRFDQRLTGGALYWEPIYLEVGHAVLTWSAHGVWDPRQQRADVEAFSFVHAGALTLNGRAVIELGERIELPKASVSVQSDDLQQFASTYLQPFVAQTAFDGLALQGRAQATLTFDGQGLTMLALSFKDLAVDDANGRIRAEGGKGSVHWARDPAAAIPSTLAWRLLSVFALPLGPAELSFSSYAQRIELLRNVRVPLLGGHLAVDAFRWQGRPDGEPNVYFAGSLDDVSLDRLSTALDWVPLSGTISGSIPGVAYRNKTLQLRGALNIDVFDGHITINNLASSGLFSDFPGLSADIAVDNLDLEQLTGKFQFGGITGRLSGYVKDLQLENWHPVGFYAWFGTPDDDDSRRRISQKAVKSIANIGGGGAADLLSRSFLSFFDTFGYDKIGIGCYLHDGVCQMIGIEAAGDGYLIIKGGGLPRIDVIGYNSQVDWRVLLERLQRITTSDEVIIK